VSRTAASTLSTPEGESPPADAVVALGERILAELNEDRTNNTLTRWMAHHVARLLEDAERAREAEEPDADARAEAARAAVLELWRARSAWPTGWPPPRAAEVARLLEAVPAVERATLGSNILATLQDLHHLMLATLVRLTVAVAAIDDVERGWLEAFGDELTPDEIVLLRLVANARDRLDLLRIRLHPKGASDIPLGDRDTEVDDEAHPEDLLVELADMYRGVIIDLHRKLTGHTVAGDDDGDSGT